MDVLALETRITNLLTKYRFADAEQELHRAKAQASDEGDGAALQHILSSLGQLYCIMEPPELDKAESCFSEVERIAGTAHSKASMAMMLYWSRHDPTRTLDKAQDAIRAARNEGDEMTLYQSLSLAGLAQIDLHDIDAASQTLSAIEEMVKRRSRIVVGDETLFLERLLAATNEAVPKRRIREIASTLSDHCRDADFAKRLKALAAS